MGGQECRGQDHPAPIAASPPDPLPAAPARSQFTLLHGKAGGPGRAWNCLWQEVLSSCLLCSHWRGLGPPEDEHEEREWDQFLAASGPLGFYSSPGKGRWAVQTSLAKGLSGKHQK